MNPLKQKSNIKLVTATIVNKKTGGIKVIWKRVG
jgi:hypothetical protein